MKIKSLRKAVSLDKGINEIGGKATASSKQKSTKMPVLKSLKNFFGRKKNRPPKHLPQPPQR